MSTEKTTTGSPLIKKDIPPRVDAAQKYLWYAECLRNPAPSFDGMRREARDLEPKEQRVYDEALEVLLRYFNRTDLYTVEDITYAEPVQQHQEVTK